LVIYNNTTINFHAHTPQSENQLTPSSFHFPNLITISTARAFPSSHTHTLLLPLSSCVFPHTHIKTYSLIHSHTLSLILIKESKTVIEREMAASDGSEYFEIGSVGSESFAFARASNADTLEEDEQ
jgi:hypothetical protein